MRLLTLDVNKAGPLSSQSKEWPQVLVAKLLRLEENEEGVAHEGTGDVAHAVARGLPRHVLLEEQVDGPAVHDDVVRGVQETYGHEYDREHEDI